MNERKSFSLIILILIVAMFCCYHIYYLVVDNANDNLVRNYTIKYENKDGDQLNTINNVVEEYFAILEIPKINLVEGFYNTDSVNNNVNKGVTMLKESTMPGENGSIIYLAAHSGTGYLAFFKDLDKLHIDDIIYLNYQNKRYSYSINDIYEINKNGTITVNHNIHDNYVVLTTCSKNKDKQLVITSKLINET